MNAENYFDWAATSPADEEILTNALKISLENYGNPSSVHELGSKSRKILEDARKKCADAIGVKASQIFFTSGGTESDHIPLLSMINRPSSKDKAAKGTVLVSGIEHPALREQCEMLKKCGFKVVNLNPDKNGFVTKNEVLKNLTDDTVFVTVMAVNNETGCIQNIYEISDAITEATKGKRRPKFHVDCVQAAGKIPLDISYTGIDSAAFSAHKICGPRGIGILYIARPETFEAFLKGGGQENGVRSGTENLFGAVAFADCLEKFYMKKNSEINKSHFELQKKLTSQFISDLMTLKNVKIIPESRANISENSLCEDDFSPYVLQATFKNIPGQVFVRALSSKGFYISTGSACSTKKQSRPILEAMGVSKDERESAVRFSFGPLTSENGMSRLFDAVKEITNTFNR